MTDQPLSEEEVRHDFSVLVDWRYHVRREAFDAWLANERAVAYAEGYTEAQREEDSL